MAAVFNAVGLGPGAVMAAADVGSNGGWELSRKRPKEENSQISSIDFLQTGSVSTGLGLSLEDRRVAASSGESPLLLLPMIDEDIGREVQRMDAEMDRFIKAQVRLSLVSTSLIVVVICLIFDSITKCHTCGGRGQSDVK